MNAGDPESAFIDTKEIGRLFYENKNDDAFAWGGVYNAAITLAMLWSISPLTDVLAKKLQWKHANGKQRIHITDLDHGTQRVWMSPKHEVY